MPIRVLDSRVVSQIAAGEVVERPASVVKELVENSLDASSSQVSIEVRGGGVNLIRVADNGVGIPGAELELAFERYATSKIDALDDLEAISTLGFRGEALPSIAAVAEVEVATCAAGEQAGSYLSLRNGTAVGRGSRGHSRGTTVTVKNLFRRVPARLKFLKSLATENSHIASVVSQYALAFPGVRFTLLIEGRVGLRSPGSGQLVDSVTEVYGLDVARNMLAIGHEPASIPRVMGMVSSPAVNRSGRGYLSFFVNRRWITSRLLARAVDDAYSGLLMQGRHPVAIIDISLQPGEMDVNIHPTKTEVKFRNERIVFAAVQRAVRRTLVEQMPVPGIREPAAAYLSPEPGRGTGTVVTGGDAIVTSGEPSLTPAASLPVLRVLGQLLASYIIAEGPDGLYLIDQHAAHERILFEKIKDQRSRRQIEVQGLLEPATFEVNPKQEEILNLYYEDLAEFGFSIEPFGDRTYLVRAVPAMLYKKNWMGMIRELLDSLSGENNSHWAEEVVISMACHSAVRAGQALTDNEMHELILELERTAIPNTCPHGRPTMIHLSSGQLRRQFGRS